MIRVINKLEYKGFVIEEHKGEEPHDSWMNPMPMHFFTVNNLFGSRGFDSLGDAKNAVDNHTDKTSQSD